MNDFGIDIAGHTGVVKQRSFELPKNATVRQRSFIIESGPGCNPEPGTKRTIRGKWLSDGAVESISSYDLEHALSPAGKRVNRLPEAIVDVQPVQLESEMTKEGKPKPRGRDAWKTEA